MADKLDILISGVQISSEVLPLAHTCIGYECKITGDLTLVIFEDKYTNSLINEKVSSALH